MTIDQAMQMAVRHQQGGNLAAAENIYQQLLSAQPGNPDALHLLGMVRISSGKREAGIELIRRAIAIRPAAEFFSNLGLALIQANHSAAAIDALRNAVRLRPGLATAHFHLGLLYATDRADEAIAAFRKTIELLPNFLQAYNNLAICLLNKGLLDETIAVCQKAIDLDPNSADAYITMSNALKAEGRLDETLRCLRRALESKPDASFLHSNVVFIAGLQPGVSGQQIFREARNWADRHARPLASQIQPHRNDPSPDRKLRIGYVSGDFTGHPVGRFMLPIITHHDRSRFEVHCFSNVDAPDAATAWFRQNADRWHDIQGLNDADCAELIRQQGIDMLIDLSLHTAGNRLLVFARKPAPVQATYLAYCGTSGMETIDYLLTDPYLLPVGADESCFSEKPIRLATSYWCYRPWSGVPDPGSLPAESLGRITFGSLNNFSKVTLPALHAWREALRRVPGSRLVLHAKLGGHRERVRDVFEEVGVEGSRVEFVGYLPAADFYALHQQIDVMLDPFPFAGGTTTCDALWMGVPVITFGGDTPVSRAGLSILSNLGLPELIAKSVDEYVSLAVNLACDLPGLLKLRSSLRDRIRNSALLNEAGFTADLESTYRTMWVAWCNSRPA